MAERARWTIYRWSTELCIPYKDLQDALRGVPPDGYRGESQAEFFGSTVLQAWEAAQRAALSPPGAEWLNPEQEGARLKKELADKAAMENAVRRGELADMKDVQSEWSQMLSNFRARMLAAPSKLAPQVNPENPNLARDLIAREHEAILADLASADAGDQPEELPPRSEPVEVSPAAPAAADGERVGGRVSDAKPRKQRRARKVEH